MHGDRAGELRCIAEQTVSPLVLVRGDGDGDGLRVKQAVQEEPFLGLAFGNIKIEFSGCGIHAAGNGKLFCGLDASAQDRAIFERDGRDIFGDHGVRQRPSRLYENGVAIFKVLVRESLSVRDDVLGHFEVSFRYLLSEFEFKSGG